jgi:hypothetical protein
MSLRSEATKVGGGEFSRPRHCDPLGSSGASAKLLKPLGILLFAKEPDANRIECR